MNEIAQAQNDLTTDLAVQIRKEHAAAIQHADKAIEHAKRAGELLLEVKGQLPHGGFLPWLDEHLNVSRRQAQRYMRAAQGKPMTARQIKNDTVSHLDWLPSGTRHAYACLADGVTISIQRLKHAPEFAQFLVLDGRTAHYTQRGIRVERAQSQIAQVMPPMHYGDGPASFDWEYHEDPAGYLNSVISDIHSFRAEVEL